MSGMLWLRDCKQNHSCKPKRGQAYLFVSSLLASCHDLVINKQHLYLNYTSDIVGSFYSFDTKSYSLLSPKFSVFNLSLDDFMLELKIVTSWLLNCSRKYRGMVSQRDFFDIISRDRKRCRRKKYLHN